MQNSKFNLKYCESSAAEQQLCLPSGGGGGIKVVDELDASKYTTTPQIHDAVLHQQQWL